MGPFSRLEVALGNQRSAGTLGTVRRSPLQILALWDFAWRGCICGVLLGKTAQYRQNHAPPHIGVATQSPREPELSEAEYAKIQGVMWPIRKNKADLTAKEQAKLDLVFQHSPDLKLAYDFREELTAIFELPLSKEAAQVAIQEWQGRVLQSGLSCFNKFLTTLNNWLDKIVNYFAGRFSSGFVEGLNNKIKTTKRRCYGILKTTTLFQRLYLDIEGYRRFA